MARRFLLIIVTLMVVHTAGAKQWDEQGADAALEHNQEFHWKFKICADWAWTAHQGGTDELIQMVRNREGCETNSRYGPPRDDARPIRDFVNEVMVGKWGYRKRVVNPNQLTSDDKQWMRDNVWKHDLYFGIELVCPDGDTAYNHMGVLLGWKDIFGFDLHMTQNNDYTPRALLFDNIKQFKCNEVWIVCRPADDQLGGCRAVTEYLSVDSNYQRMHHGQSGEPGWGWNTHREVCCWKGHARHSWPWTDNPSGYACLSWEHNAQKTWDTMVSPRIDLRGRTGTRLHQMSLSTLTKGTRRVLGSTDDGQTWPYVIGSDQLQTADLPWADNKQKVRLAWAYSGPVRLGEYWALDEIWVMARPSRDHDICVTEARPRGIVGHGTRLQPWVRVFNRGEKADTFDVTLKIGSYLYNQTRQVSLNPYSDTSLRFTPDWTATPGTHTVVAYASSAMDEFRGNDTVVMTVRVVADTWV